MEYGSIAARQMARVSACACARVIPDLRRPPRSSVRLFDVECLWPRPQRLEGVEWNAHVRCRVHGGSVERAGHHAHDHERVAVQHDRPPYGRWIAVEASPPKAVAQDGRRRRWMSPSSSSVSVRPNSAGTPSTSKNSGVTMWTRTCSAGAG